MLPVTSVIAANPTTGDIDQTVAHRLDEFELTDNVQ